jgi:hypothetical protein
MRKTVVVTLEFLLAAALFGHAGTYRNDFRIMWDYGDDVKAGVWEEVAGPFQYDGGMVRSSYEDPAGLFLLFSPGTLNDCTVEVRARADHLLKDGFGIVVGRPYSRLETYFTGALTGESAAIFRDKKTELSAAPFVVELGRWYNLKLTIQGQHLEFFVDGKLVAAVDDPANPAAKVGFFACGTVFFDDFIVTGPQVRDGGRWEPKDH